MEPPYVSILDHVEAVARRRTYRDLMPRDRRGILLYALVAVALERCGRKDEELRHMVERALSTRYALRVERIPYREMDLQHFLMLLGSTDGAPLDSVFERTLAAGDPNVVELTDGDAYAITHAILYLYDFSLRTPAIPDEPAPRLSTVVDALLSRYRGEANADLVAELLACAACVGLESAEVDDSWDFLRSAQLADGRVEGPPDVLPPLDGVDDQSYSEWRSSYHTTAVAVLACLVQRGSRGRPRIEHPARSRSEVEKASEAIVRAGRAFEIQWSARESEQSVAALRLAERTLGTRLLSTDMLRRLVARIEGDSGGASAQLAADTCVLLQDACADRGLNAPSLEETAHLVVDAARACTTSGTLPPHAGLLVALGWCELDELTGLPFPTGAADASVTAEELVLHSSGVAGIVEMDRLRHAQTRAGLAARLARSNSEYRIDEVALVIRALPSVGGPVAHRLAGDGVAVLLSQQRVDGLFGYFGRDDDGSGRDLLHVTTRAITALVAYIEAERLGFPSAVQ